MAYTKTQIQNILISAAKKYGVDPKVVLAIAQHESGFRPEVNNRGLNKNGTVDWGLMQLNDITLQTYGLTPEQALDPVVNAEYGVRLLKSNLDKFGGDLDRAIWGYAAGPGNVKGTPNDAIVKYQNYVKNYQPDPWVLANFDGGSGGSGGSGSGSDGSDNFGGNAGWFGGWGSAVEPPSASQAGSTSTDLFPPEMDVAGEEVGLVVLGLIGLVGLWIAAE